MSRLELVKDISNRPELKDIYTDIINNGFGNEEPMSYFTALGNRPDLLKSTWNFLKSILVEGELPATVKQMVSLAISHYNECQFCSVSHTYALESLGVSQDIIKGCLSNDEMEDIPVSYRSIIKFSIKSVKNAKSITDDDFDKLRENGLSESEITELVLLISLTNFSNTYTDIAKIPLDFG